MTTTFDSKEDFIMHTVTPLDNLIALAVKYRTSVAAIKRANPVLKLNGSIPPTTKEIRIPASAKVTTIAPPPVTADSSISEAGSSVSGGSLSQDDVEKATQMEANERYYKFKAFVQKFNCSEGEAVMYLEKNGYSMENAIAEVTKDIQFKKVQSFVDKVGGHCTVEEAEAWLQAANWRVEMAIHMRQSNAARIRLAELEFTADDRQAMVSPTNARENQGLLSNMNKYEAGGEHDPEDDL
jgi:hypothetical protein